MGLMYWRKRGYFDRLPSKRGDAIFLFLFIVVLCAYIVLPTLWFMGVI